ncbi:MAG: hypothetical protein VX768_11840 [Planctomycetota bacterium]|nr:hypothetical protein [Planctomycetota bacterium]
MRSFLILVLSSVSAVFTHSQEPDQRSVDKSAHLVRAEDLQSRIQEIGTDPFLLRVQGAVKIPISHGGDLEIQLDNLVELKTGAEFQIHPEIAGRIKQWIGQVAGVAEKSVESFNLLAGISHGRKYDSKWLTAVWMGQMLDSSLDDLSNDVMFDIPDMEFVFLIRCSTVRNESKLSITGDQVIVIPSPLPSTSGSIRKKFLMPCRVFGNSGDFNSDIFELSLIGSRQGGSKSGKGSSQPSTPEAAIIEVLKMLIDNFDKGKSLDADKDGKLTSGEIPKNFAALLKAFDSNSDGALDKKELETVLAKRMSQMPGGVLQKTSEDLGFANQFFSAVFPSPDNSYADYLRKMGFAGEETAKALNRSLYGRMTEFIRKRADACWDVEKLRLYYVSAKKMKPSEARKLSAEVHRRYKAVIRETRLMLGGCSDPIWSLIKIQSLLEKLESLVGKEGVGFLHETVFGKGLCLVIDLRKTYLCELNSVMPIIARQAQLASSIDPENVKANLAAVKKNLANLDPRLKSRPNVPPPPTSPRRPGDPFMPSTATEDMLVTRYEKLIVDAERLLRKFIIEMNTDKTEEWGKLVGKYKRELSLARQLQAKAIAKQSDHIRKRDAGQLKSAYQATEKGRQYLKRMKEYGELLQTYKVNYQKWTEVKKEIIADHEKDLLVVISKLPRKQATVDGDWSSGVFGQVANFKVEYKKVNVRMDGGGDRVEDPRKNYLFPRFIVNDEMMGAQSIRQ